MEIPYSIRRAFLAGTLAVPILISGCAVRARYYDADHRDYHRWSNAEQPHYDAWVTETHRGHEDYHKLKPEDRKAYWNWRHDHP